MPRHAADRPAAYTRTRLLERFLEVVSDAVPPEMIDTRYIERAIDKKEGDVRAFQQSLRVLGLTDAVGRPTERLHLARSRRERWALLQEGLREAYPELTAEWETRGGLSREEVEDHFKTVFGLSRTSAAPAAKLFLDLWTRGPALDYGRRVEEAAVKGGEAAAASPEPVPEPPERGPETRVELGEAEDVWARRERALSVLGQLVQVRIDHQWDVERIRAVFEGLNGLVDRVVVGEVPPDWPIGDRFAPNG